jgi:hypothetical protein
VDAAVALDRRLANYRALLARAPVTPRDGDVPPRDRGIPGRIRADARVDELAAVLDAEIVRSERGTFIRIEQGSTAIPVDRDRLARLPGQPPVGVPLVCLDTETTGLATAAGTLAFLVGLGWWNGDRFHQLQLLLPDHADEQAVLDELAARLPSNGWLVTYNGRGFDWPLLVARYRLARRSPPALGGHLDLLPIVRRLFRHRMADARLGTVEGDLLGVVRDRDVEGWEIPGRYLEFVRGGSAGPLVDVVRHNDEDVRSLAHLVAHVERGFGDRAALCEADPGDVAGLARIYAREQRLDDALACLDVALLTIDRPARTERARPAADAETEPWWSPAHSADFGGRPRREPPLQASIPLAATWTSERLAVERAHLLRRLGRHREAEAAWLDLAAGVGRVAALAAVELAKVREHRLRDVTGAMAAVELGWRILERRRRLGRPEPRLEGELVRRGARLRRRCLVTRNGRARAAAHAVTPPSVESTGRAALVPQRVGA